MADVSKVSGSVLVVLLVVVIAGLGSSYVKSAGAPTDRLPYTVILEETVQDGKGGSHVASVQTWAVRSDGAKVLKMGPLEGGGRRITYPWGERITTNDATRRKTTFRHRPEALGLGRLAGTQCMLNGSERVHGEEVISGWRAVRLVTTQAGQTSEAWYALELSCAPLGRTVRYSNGTSSEVRLRSITAGEPASELFAGIELFTEGPPSSLDDEPHGAECDPRCQERQAAYWARRNAAYEKNRSGK